MNIIGRTIISANLASLLIIFSIAVIFFSTINFASTQETGTQVSGIISSNTTWTKANSPYFFTGNALVNNDVILTIEPGVTVYLNDYYLRVNGTLSAKGLSTEQISFIRNSTLFGGFSQDSAIQFTSNSKGWNEITQTGSKIEYTFLNSSLIQSDTINIDG